MLFRGQDTEHKATMIRVHVHGASGRLGQAIVRVAESEGKYQLSLSGRNDDLAPLLADADVALDVSQPEGSVLIAEACAAERKPLVIGTTGHSPAQIAELRSKSIPILLAPNFSVGVNLLFWLTQKTAEVLGPEFDAEIVEMHHRLKRDSPSGTAERLGEIISGARDQKYSVQHGRAGIIGPRPENEIGMHAVRGGDVVGEHTVYFAGLGERLELTHRASSRETFARGALRAAVWLIGKPAGWYDMLDVLGLEDAEGAGS
jgi:4-hydroxy-tetrahydrodipicolinate reductase